ncbi:MAG: ADP-heptose--LPS heptosyltransferase RfaF, partial [Leeuwenhoekiella sp.]
MGKSKNIEKFKKKKEKSLLVIRLSALGDVAMCVPVLLALCQSYPQLSLKVLSNPLFKPFFAKIDCVSFIEARVKKEHKGFFGIFKLYREIPAKDFNAVADLHNVIRSKILGFLFRISGKKVVKINKGRAEKKELIKESEKNLIPLKSSQERYAEVFAKLGFPVTLNKSHVLGKQIIKPEIHKIIGSEPHKWLGIAPFAAH